MKVKHPEIDCVKVVDDTYKINGVLPIAFDVYPMDGLGGSKNMPVYTPRKSTGCDICVT